MNGNKFIVYSVGPYNSLQNTTRKTKDYATQIWLNIGFLLHSWHLSCYSYYQLFRKEPDCDYDKRNIFAVIWNSLMFLTHTLVLVYIVHR